MDKNSWIDIMLVEHLLIDHSFSAMFGMHDNAWKTFVVSLSMI